MSARQTASLPMYDLPELRAVTDAWWIGIARHMRKQGVADVPRLLLHDQSVSVLWTDADLLFSQCCGFDVTFGYKDRLAVLVSPDYAIDGFEPCCYDSRIVVHEDAEYSDAGSLFGRVAVINSRESHSGMNALMSHIDPCSRDGIFFQKIIVSGSHSDSLRAVQKGQADVAAIDSVTFELLRRYRPDTIDGVRVLDRTIAAPTLPYVTRTTTSEEIRNRLQAALLAAFDDPDLALTRDELLIRGGEIPEPGLYERIRKDFVFDQRLMASALRESQNELPG